MVDENRHPEAPASHATVRYERTDAKFRYILATILLAMLLAAGIHSVLLWFLYHYEGYQADIKASPYPLATQPSTALPPEPRLEELNRYVNIERSNVYERQQKREFTLDTYGPTGEEGYVHVPIGQAMKVLANQLPVRPAASAGRRRENGLVDAGESNSGRMFRKEPLWSER